MRPRSRVRSIVWILLIMTTGLAIREFPQFWPSWAYLYLADSLWALLVFRGFCLLLPRATPVSLGKLALTFAVCVELSQLIQTPGLRALRQTPLGLILGHGFLWSDLIAYVLGIGFGVGVDLWVRRGQSKERDRLST